MMRGLLASLTCLVVAACSAPGPTPTTSTQPTATLAALPTPAPTATPTIAASPTGLPTPTGTPGVEPTTSIVNWTDRVDIAARPSAREDHTWTVDREGSVAYLFGGRSADGPSNELWAFDLISDEWTQLQPSGEPPAPRFGHTATWVPGFGLAVWSGQGGDFYDDIWAYDPLTDAWHQLPSLGAVPEARYGSCASLGPDGRLWISHGFTQDDGRFADTRAYDFGTGEWTDMTPAGDVPVKRCLHDCWWSGTGLMLFGGQTTGIPALGDEWTYRLERGAWEPGRDATAPELQLYALAVLPDGAGLLFGGGTPDGGYSNKLWRIDADPGTAMTVPIAGPMPTERSGATMIADPTRDRALLFGGLGSDGLLGDLWELGGLGSIGP